MKIADGPYAGKYHDDTWEIAPNEQFILQQRCKIDGTWCDVDHVYELQEDDTVVYQFSQFSWREGIR